MYKNLSDVLKHKIARYWKVPFAILVFFSLLNSVNAQEKVITGTITDASGGALPGVSVMEKGSKNGTLTDGSGKFSIKTKPSAVLVISYLGFVSKEVSVAGKTSISIQLEEDSKQLDQVIVVGYGTQTKRENSGAVSTIKADQIQRITAPSFEQALQGTVSGLQIKTNGGSPDAPSRIQIRGTNSITAGTEPLILVDGIPVSTGAFSTVNSNDIASLTVLKDASATSIYGSRGANGVILVTTKNGANGKGTLDFTVETGLNKPINMVELANADQWRAVTEKARTNQGLPNPLPTEPLLYDIRQITRFDDLNIYGKTNTDWVDQMIDTKGYQQYSFSTSQGSDKSSYYVSGQYRDQDGNYKGENFKRFTGRMNLDFTPKEYLKMGVRYNYSNVNYDKRWEGDTNNSFRDIPLNYGNGGGYGVLYNRALPIFPVVWPDNGAPFDPFNNVNPVYSSDDANAANDIITNRNIGNIFGEVKPIKGLTLRGELGIDYTITDQQEYISERLRLAQATPAQLAANLSDRDIRLQNDIYKGSNRFQLSRKDQFNLNVNATATYQTKFAKDHNINALIGWEQLRDEVKTNSQIAQNVISRDPGVFTEARIADQLIEMRQVIGNNVRFSSIFGRLNYNFKERYYLQASLRRDGSSIFAPSERFNVFPSISGAWILSDEPFMQNSPVTDLFNIIKIKGGWGVTGNANIPPFQYLPGQFAAWPFYSSVSNALIQNTLSSGDIKWEESRTVDAGLELGLFKNRLTFSASYYQNNTSDMLLSIPTSLSLGIYETNGNTPGATANIGSLRNEGFEFEINSTNIINKNFSWTTDFNFSTNKNKVTALYEGFNGSPTQFGVDGITVVQVGKPLGMFYLPAFAGYDANGNPMIKEVDAAKAATYEYEFTGNNIVPTSALVNANRVINEDKTGLPTYFGGLGNTINYKGFTFRALLTFSGGNYIYDNVGYLRNVGSGSSVLRREYATAAPGEYGAPTWGNKEINPAPGTTAKTVGDKSDKWLEKGDYARLKVISLGYSLPQSVLKNKFIGSAKVFVNLNNVATFSKYKAYDPEIVRTGGSQQEQNVGQGIVGGVPYFQVFTASLGVNIGF